MHDSTYFTVEPLEFLGRTLLIFLLLEILFLPLRQPLSSFLSEALNANISWECTALDETFLLLSALLTLGVSWKKILLGVGVVQCYNLLRIWILSLYPDPVLHEILFRWGGFLLVVLSFWVLGGQSNLKTPKG